MINYSTDKFNIVVIGGCGTRTPPEDFVNTQAVLDNFLRILDPVSKELYLITRDFPCNFIEKVRVRKIKTVGRREFLPITLVRYLLMQLKICFELLKISKDIDIAIFYSGSAFFPLPMLCSRLLRKKVICFVTGVISRYQFPELTRFGFYVLKIIERLNFHLADQVVVESPAGINLMKLNRFKRKIVSSGALYIDTDIFRISKDVQERRNLVGYIGRLAYGKGVENFIQAIPLILKERNDLDFLIGGGGTLFNNIKEKLERDNLFEKVKLTGWIPHEELPRYLNELKLFILPSDEEGLPAAVQEAMACGTVVLATKVGCLPDLIKEGETGFFLQDNSPECIARDVIRALNYPNLEAVVQNAQRLIEQEYSYKSMVQKYKLSLDELVKKK